MNQLYYKSCFGKVLSECFWKGKFSLTTRRPSLATVTDCKYLFTFGIFCSFLRGPSTLNQVGMNSTQIWTFTLQSYPCSSISEGHYSNSLTHIIHRYIANYTFTCFFYLSAYLTWFIFTLNWISAGKISKWYVNMLYSDLITAHCWEKSCNSSTNRKFTSAHFIVCLYTWLAICD